MYLYRIHDIYMYVYNTIRMNQITLEVILSLVTLLNISIY